MKQIRTFEEYNDQYNEELNEGFKEAVVGGLLSLLSFGTVKGQHSSTTIDNIEKQDKKTVSTTLVRKHDFNIDSKYTKPMADSTVNDLLKQGWSLDSTKLDTLYKDVIRKIPSAQFTSTVIKTDTSNFFASGKFELNPKLKEDINKVLDSLIKEKMTLFKINIVSSTDKQRVSQNLQNQLQQLGYTPDNSGLSKARSEELKKYLNSKGIADSLIEINNLVEQGDSVSAEHRYAKISFTSCCKHTDAEVSDKEISTVHYTAYMSKTWVDEKEKKKFLSGFHFPTIRINLGGSDNQPSNRGSVKCPRI